METKTLLQSLLHVAWCLEPFECYMHLNILFPEDFLMLQCYNKWFLEFMLSIYSYSGINLSNLPLRLGSCLCKAPAVVLGLGKPNLAFCILHGPSLWQVLSNGGSAIVLKNERTPYWALWLNSHIKLCWALYSLFIEKKKNRTTLKLTTMSIPCEAMVQLRAYPSTRTLSLALPPCALRTLIALIGYLASPLFPARLTAMTALTIISLKKSDAWLISFDDRDVFATFTTLSLPSSSTLIVKCSWIYLHASLKNKKDQIKTLHLCLSWVRILSFIDLLSKIRNNSHLISCL